MLFLSSAQLVVFPYTTIFLASRILLQPPYLNDVTGTCGLPVELFLNHDSQIAILTHNSSKEMENSLANQIENNEDSQSLVFHFALSDVESLLDIIEQVKQFPSKVVKLHKWMFSLNLDKCFNSTSKDEFQSQLKTILETSNFLQDNPLYLNMEVQNVNVICLVGYRIDIIQPKGVIKKINASTSNSSCISELLKLKLSSTTGDFNGETLTVIGVNDSNNLYYNKFVVSSQNNETSLTLEDCFGAELLEAMKFMLNLRVKILVSTNWGQISHGGGSLVWLGVVSDILQGNADLIISNLAQIPERSDVLDFTMPLSVLTVNAFLRKVNDSSASSIKTSPLLAPFKWNLWIATGITFGVFSIMSTLLKYLSEKHNAIQDLSPYCIETDTSKYQKKQSHIFSSRTQYLCQAVVALLLNAAYAGTLTSHLSIQLNPIKNLQDVLSEKYSFKYRIDPFPLIQRFVQNSSEPKVRELYKRVPKVERKSNSSNDEDDMSTRFSEEIPIEEIARGNFIYITDQVAFYRDLNKIDPMLACDIQQIKFAQKNNFQTWESQAVKKSSGIKRTIDFSILKMLETGNVDLWKKRHYPLIQKCEEKHEFKTTNFWDLLLAFQVLFVFVILSLGLLVVESLTSHLIK